MSARIKVMRLLGSVLVTLALVLWLGISSAAATGGGGDRGNKGSHDAKSHHDGDGKSAKSDKEKRESDRDDKSKKDRDHDDGDDRDDRDHKSKKDRDHKSKKDRDHDGGGGHDGHGDDDSDGHGGGGHTTPPPSTTPPGGGGHHQKVTLCHRTNSETNPYVRITVSINSVVKGHGHDGHNGPVFEPGMKSAKQKWGDIIPSFGYTTKGGSSASYGGKNWPAGQAVFNAGCTAPTQPTTPPNTPPTTPPTDTVTETPDTSVAPTKIGTPGDDETRVLGSKSGSLAETGLHLPLAALAGLCLALLLAGGALMVVPARMDKERNRRH